MSISILEGKVLRVLLGAICMCSYASYAFAQSSSDILAYINQYKQIALDQEKQYGIPASITLAQGILESGAGRSGLTRNSVLHNRAEVWYHSAADGTY